MAQASEHTRDPEETLDRFRAATVKERYGIAEERHNPVPSGIARGRAELDIDLTPVTPPSQSGKAAG